MTWKLKKGPTFPLANIKHWSSKTASKLWIFQPLFLCKETYSELKIILAQKTVCSCLARMRRKWTCGTGTLNIWRAILQSKVRLSMRKIVRRTLQYRSQQMHLCALCSFWSSNSLTHTWMWKVILDCAFCTLLYSWFNKI
jgi:hypothetical protein